MSEDLSKIPEGAKDFQGPYIGGSFKKFEVKEQEQPLEVNEETLKKFENLFKEAKNLILVTDLDGTIITGGKGPKESKINTLAKKSLERLKEAGITLAVMTGRAGADGAVKLEIPGAIIVGTAGWEVYKTDPNDPSKGESFIHEEFRPYAEKITALLHKIRNEFFQATIQSDGDKETKDITSEIETKDGLVVLEKKAINKEFPEGLSHTYNFNQINKEKWVKLVNFTEELFINNFPPELKNIIEIDHTGKNDELRKEKELGRKMTPDEKKTFRENFIPNYSGYSVSFSPKSGEGKDKSLIQILRSDDDINKITGEPKRKEYFKGMPGGFDGVIFIGDSNQDAKAIRAAHLTSLLAGRKSAGVVVFRPEVPDMKGQEKAVRYADVQAEKIEGNAELLSKLADLAEKYYRK